jgi:hypothetical protein
MNKHVTLPNDELSKVTTDTDSVTSAKEQARERKRRQRARAKQETTIEFVRTDASLFLHPDRLSQKAGAPKSLLRRMAIKELVDNALDAATNVDLTVVNPDTFVIEDDGPGIAPQKAVALFSVTRPMMSTKLIRRPMRGAVGNGLRVATGAAFASGGNILVESRGRRQELDFDRATGETTVASSVASDVSTGTRITVTFGAALPRDTDAALWGATAIHLKGKAAEPMLTHPAWYSETSFMEVINSARGTAKDLASVFGVDLCHAPKAAREQGQSKPVERDIDPDGPAASLTLDMLKARAPKPPKLIPIADDAFNGAYKSEKIEAVVAGGTVPAIVQVWATEIGTRPVTSIQLIVNRTPTFAELSLYPGGEAWLSGCGLKCGAGMIPKGGYRIVIAVTTPAIALISDGKTPDLTPFKDGIVSALSSAARRAHRPVSKGVSIAEAAYTIMEQAYLRASANGTLPANARQIMYSARGYILAQTGLPKLNDHYFTQTLLPNYVNENPRQTADWDVVYDARGHFVEPHSRKSIPLGTLQVRQYLNIEREQPGALVATASGLHRTVGPNDRYGAVLFIEKEGFEPLLRKAKIAERFDIAVMSTKGMSVVAARAMVDRISSDGLKILVAHDLDATGMGIFGTLGGDNHRYTFKERPNLVRLGLTLGQAEDMNLDLEPQKVEGDHEEVGDRLSRYGATWDEIDFILAGQRIELNAMPSDVFVEWLEKSLAAHDVKKIVPDADLVEERARHILGINLLKQEVADLERAAKEQAASIALPEDLIERVRNELENNPAAPWEEALSTVIDDWQGE